MSKNSTRKEKLRNYSVLAGTLAAATAVNGQIIYTDVIPDQTITTGNSYMLDMNNDANDDFGINVSSRSGSMSGFSYSGVGIAITTIGSNAGAIAHVGSTFPLNYVDALGMGSPINTSQNFLSAATSSNQSALLLGTAGTIGGFVPFSFGDWLGQSDMYLGLKFGISSVNYFGWARLDVNAGASQFVIKDYAYNSTAADAPINAGQTVLSVNELDLRDQMDMMIVDGQLVINLRNSDLSNGVVTVTNLSGQQISSFNLNTTNAKFDLSTLASGMYIINVVFDQGIASEKLFIR